MPPRWTWPRIVMRVSKPVRCSISRSSHDRDAAEAHVAELVDLAGLRRRASPSSRRRALGDDDDRERRRRRRGGARGARRPRRCRTAARARGSTSAPPAMPGVDGDPAGVAAHHLDDDHAVVRLGRRVQAVDRVGGDLHRGLEAEREVGAGEVVVDRLRARRRPRRRRRPAGARRRACPRRRSGSARRRRRARSAAAHRSRPSVRPCTGSCARCRGSCRRGAGCRASFSSVSSIASPSSTPAQP